MPVVAAPVVSNTAFSTLKELIERDDTMPVTNLAVVKLEQTNPLVETIESIDSARVILVGETHTRYDHHLVQLEIMKLLYQKSPQLAIGVEWFQQPFQPHLDAYIKGEISEREMLQRTEYFDRWRYDYRLYRPIIRFARDNGIPVIALNASRELSEALTESGFEDLPEELKAQLPESYDWSDEGYENRLREVFELHPEYEYEFENFLRGQLTWDESMAERAAEYLQANPDSRMLVFAGSGHIAYGSGIPNRIKRRIDVEQYSILVSEDYQQVDQTIADYLVLSPEQNLQSAGLIGAILDIKAKQVVIKGYSHNSAVEAAGVAAGAVIVGVDGENVETFADFKIAMLDKLPGDRIELHYLETAEADRDEVKSIELELR